MKIQIDTDVKTIKVMEDVKLTDLIKAIKNLFPNDEWLEYKLETNTVIHNWNYPIIVNPYSHRPHPWWWQGATSCATPNNHNTVFNLEVN